ncbi:Hypothetical protein DEACI_2666 [Acididesulfobacillus acetoxydans]|uniref:Uncharacterized protein n=1 Tax=Acididesulfobacillus acetoxydans TaxID=1561005 RepID=A0A8S0Y3F6_9FIRM|nr:Hypothetical protein DEACI_2666 [Acididesulfobacillus acetoxydans]CEJ08162.1 Hypothetical protein DEACI_2637 [Acididesulfobacillus acetoxydans]
MTLSPSKDPNIYTLTLTGNLKWLDDPSRAYPITLDPSFATKNWYTTTSAGGGMGTYIASYAPDTYYYPTSYMTTGYDSVNQGVGLSLIKFPKPTLPSGAIVTDAAMSIYKYTTTNTPSEQLDARRNIKLQSLQLPPRKCHHRIQFARGSRQPDPQWQF